MLADLERAILFLTSQIATNVSGDDALKFSTAIVELVRARDVLSYNSNSF